MCKATSTNYFVLPPSETTNCSLSAFHMPTYFNIGNIFPLPIGGEDWSGGGGAGAAN